jgi:hypothetical protein
VNDLPDSMEDVGNIEVRAVRKLKLGTYENFCVEKSIAGNNEGPCKYLFGDDIFDKAGQRQIVNKIIASDETLLKSIENVNVRAIENVNKELNVNLNKVSIKALPKK